MFNLLSSQTSLLTLLSKYSTQELEIVCDNLTLIIKRLSLSTTELLANRRNYSELLPQVNKVAGEETDADKTQVISSEQLLLDQNNLIKVINSFCLSEAVIVRNNFSNCLDFIVEQGVEILPIATVESEDSAISEGIRKSNVSPIRLAEIKQRLASAVQTRSAKQEQIKSRLNSLLALPATGLLKNADKQA